MFVNFMNWGESGSFNQSGLTAQNAQYQQMLQQSQQQTPQTTPQFLPEEGRDERAQKESERLAAEAGGLAKLGGGKDYDTSGYGKYKGDYQNPGTFNSTDVQYLGNTNIEVLNAMAPIAKQYGFKNVEEEHQIEKAQTEAEKKQKIINILQTAGSAAMFIPYVGPGLSVGLQAAAMFV